MIDSHDGDDKIDFSEFNKFMDKIFYSRIPENHKEHKYIYDNKLMID